jgi:hypothetical protein
MFWKDSLLGFSQYLMSLDSVVAVSPSGNQEAEKLNTMSGVSCFIVVQLESDFRSVHYTVSLIYLRGPSTAVFKDYQRGLLDSISYFSTAHGAWTFITGVAPQAFCLMKAPVQVQIRDFGEHVFNYA